MNQEQIYDKVIHVISPYAKDANALANISKESRIFEDLDVNSARLVDIVLAFEDEFNIEVEDEAADKIMTIQDAVDMISKKV